MTTSHARNIRIVYTTGVEPKGAPLETISLTYTTINEDGDHREHCVDLLPFQAQEIRERLGAVLDAMNPLGNEENARKARIDALESNARINADWVGATAGEVYKLGEQVKPLFPRVEVLERQAEAMREHAGGGGVIEQRIADLEQRTTGMGDRVSDVAAHASDFERRLAALEESR